MESFDLEGGGLNAYLHGWSNLNDTTDIVVSGGGNDIHVYDYDLGGTLTGLATPILCSFVRCDHWNVEFSNPSPVTSGFTAGDWKNVGCHEFGHTGGLDEQYSSAYTPSCQWYGHSATDWLYHSHDIALINSHV